MAYWITCKEWGRRLFPCSARPNVKPGYVDPSVKIDQIAVDKTAGGSRGFQGHVQLTPSRAGIHPICLQTVDHLGSKVIRIVLWPELKPRVNTAIRRPIRLSEDLYQGQFHDVFINRKWQMIKHKPATINRDEVCFSVDVKTDTSTLYGFHELPHFIEPSIPASSVVSCGVGEPCHMMFHVSPGDNHTSKCVTVKDVRKSFQNLHVFSSCDCVEGEVGTCIPCTNSIANNNCTVDVSLTPVSSEIGAETLCIQASIKGLDIQGEERCLHVTVEALTVHKKARGCQVLHCQNGGFCDSHLTTPLCYCPLGYTGFQCETAIPGGLPNGTKLPALLETGLIDEVRCFQNEVCKTPFQVIGENQTIPAISTGYVDPTLKSVGIEISNASLFNFSSIYSGNIVVTTPVTGSHRLCLQTHHNNSFTTDEKCIIVHVDATLHPPVEQAKPHFFEPTPLHGSTISCVAENACFLNLYYTTGDQYGMTRTCCDLSLSSKSNVEGFHLFEAKYLAPVCSSSLAYIAWKSDIGSLIQLCFQVSVPGKRGEERCFNVKVENKSAETSPCKSVVCLHGGRCIADLNNNTKMCLCPAGFHGPHCDQGVTSTKPMTEVKVSKPNTLETTTDSLLTSLSTYSSPYCPESTPKETMIQQGREKTTTTSVITSDHPLNSKQTTMLKGSDEATTESIMTFSHSPLLSVSTTDNSLWKTDVNAKETTIQQGRDKTNESVMTYVHFLSNASTTGYRSGNTLNSKHSTMLKRSNEISTESIMSASAQVSTRGYRISNATVTAKHTILLKSRNETTTEPSMTSTPSLLKVSTTGKAKSSTILKSRNETTTQSAMASFIKSFVPSTLKPSTTDQSLGETIKPTTLPQSMDTAVSGILWMSAKFRSTVIAPSRNASLSTKSDVFTTTSVSHHTLASNPGTPISAANVFSSAVKVTFPLITSPATQRSNSTLMTKVNPSATKENVTGICSMNEASRIAHEAVKMGLTSCSCIINGTKRNVIRRRPVATNPKLLWSAGIGVAGSTGLMLLTSLAYFLICKLKRTKETNTTERRRPSPSPRSRAKIYPQTHLVESD